VSGLERRLREGRPGTPEPPAALEERLLAAVRRPPRSPAAWRRAVPSSRGGRLIAVALLTLAAGAGALAAGVLQSDRGSREAVAAPVAATWGSPTVLVDGLRGVPDAAVGMDAGGGSLVAWSTGGAVRVVHRPNGGVWTSPVRLSPVGVAAKGLALAVGGDGSAIVVWRERRDARVARRILRFPDGSVAGTLTNRLGGRYVLVARRFDPDTGWSALSDVSPASGNQRDMRTPRAVVAGDRFLVGWTRQDAVEVREVGRDGTLGDVARLTSDGGAGDPFLAADSAGEAVATWSTVSRQGAARVWAVDAATLEDGTWSQPERLGRRALYKPRPVAVLSGEGPVVAWTLWRPRRPTVVLAARRLDAAWQRPALLSSPGRSSFAPALAAVGGDTVVAQFSAGGTTLVSQSVGRRPWTHPVGVGTAAIAQQYGPPVPSLASPGDGRLVGAFGRRAGVTVRDWTSRGRFGPPQTLLETGWQGGFTGLAASPAGSAVVLITGLGHGRRGWELVTSVRDARQGATP
jgi:hypothetical protein